MRDVDDAVRRPVAGHPPLGASLVLAALVCLASSSSSWAIEAIYSSIAEEDCAPVEHLTIGERVHRSSQEQSIFECSGPPGHVLYIIDDGTRSWYALERNEQVHSLENDIVREFRHGNFPNVPTAGLVEWGSTSSGKVVGLIFRIMYQRQMQEGVQQASALFVYNLEGEEPRFLGNAESNAEARRLLERSLS